ncbi:MAG: PDZ domain-containing protein [Bacilli bacterium]|nr:PDZ domain-containing protein [Bacilli bacterium]
MKLKKFIFKILIVASFIIPNTVLAYSKYVIPGGETIGIEVNSKGILVIGFYKVNNTNTAKNAGFKTNDIIIEVNNQKVSSISEMTDVIKNINAPTIKFKVLRKNIKKDIELPIIYDENNILKTGLYVKDKINGVGTLSYIDPTTKIFGSLGHEIIESSTATKFEIKDGNIYDAKVSSIIRSKVGNAGEKNAIYDKDSISGEINENTISGVFGKYLDEINEENIIEIADKESVTTGEAIIRTVVNDDKIEDFTINIINVNKDHQTKNILFEITDEKLLEKTGGIVQGMSGSPIIQNNKLIGAVNYVVVNDPKKGYGIFITTMLEEGEN